MNEIVGMIDGKLVNFETVKEMIAGIVGCDAADVTIGFTHRTYDVTFADGIEIGKEAKFGQPAGIAEAQKIVGVVADAVARTIEFWTWDNTSVTIVFGINTISN